VGVRGFLKYRPCFFLLLSVVSDHAGVFHFLSLTLLGLPLQAVHLAARSGHTDVFKLLLDAGGRVDVNNREGKSPFFYAQQYKALKPLVIKKPPPE
jgi:hypothetical protein